MDSGRLYYEAALLFDDMAAYDRAIVCYLRSTIFCDASDVISSIDLPEDDTYRKKLERMSNSYLYDFHMKRSGRRERLVFAEKERQRLRVRSHIYNSFHFLPLRFYILRLGRRTHSCSVFIC